LRSSPKVITTLCRRAAFGLVIPGLMATPQVARAATADTLVIVDCLLPGRVQRLGAEATYVQARRAIKTSAADCRVRGGEYTEAGEATYAGLMRVWLPMARNGDHEAQTNLGEIFERGLGGSPQYDLAIQWYRLAAEANYPRAQVNLGSLFERGLGTTRDMEQAMSWYRRAAGLTGSIGAASTAEINRLRDERDALAGQLV